jgi:hypothetical protein
MMNEAVGLKEDGFVTLLKTILIVDEFPITFGTHNELNSIVFVAVGFENVHPEIAVPSTLKDEST